MRHLSIRTLLISLNLLVLILPVAGIQLMRLYESALVRQTESALIAQAAFISAFYRSLLRDAADDDMALAGSIPNPFPHTVEGRWVPRPATLDLATSQILPPFPDGVESPPADSLALSVGEHLIPVLKDAQLVTLAGIRVVDLAGVIIASTSDDVGQTILEGEEIALALQGRPASRLRRKAEVVDYSPLDSISRTSRVRVFVSSPIVSGDRLLGAVMLSRTPPSVVQALYAKRWLLFQALMVLVALAVLMSLLAFRLIARPIRALAEQASGIARGELTATDVERSLEATRPGTIEVASLRSAITNMASALEQRANYLQDFMRHVSHEFKTPLAGIGAAVEVLQDHDGNMDEARRRQFLDNIAADARRMTRLTQRLLELTRAELNNPATQTINVENAAAAFVETAAVEGVTLSSRSSLISSTALGNSQALGAVFEILLENSTQHGASRFELLLSASTDGGRIVITAQDNGQGITPGNRPKVFEPFFTTERGSGGTGLGLSIAEALLRRFGGTLRLVDDESAGGARFEITLRAEQP